MATCTTSATTGTWMRLEETMATTRRPLPVCTGGARAAPPEDCGGVYAFHELVAAVSDAEGPVDMHAPTVRAAMSERIGHTFKF